LSEPPPIYRVVLKYLSGRSVVKMVQSASIEDALNLAYSGVKGKPVEIVIQRFRHRLDTLREPGPIYNDMMIAPREPGPIYNDMMIAPREPGPIYNDMMIAPREPGPIYNDVKYVPIEDRTPIDPATGKPVGWTPPGPIDPGVIVIASGKFGSGVTPTTGGGEP
jgi:hypothetical protein